MIDKNFNVQRISAAILAPPLVDQGRVAKGVLLLNHVDDVVRLLPALPRYFFIIERRGWNGLAHSILADIKLVEDLSTLEETRRCYPRALLLPLSNADFVDTDVFRPLDAVPEYDVISIGCWSPRKRIELSIRAAALLPGRRFVHLASFNDGGTREERAYRDSCLRLASELHAPIEFPFALSDDNRHLPWAKDAINGWINKASIGVLTATAEGHNRFKMECMAANRPMLLAADAGSTTHKHLVPRTGASFVPRPDALAVAIGKMLDEHARYGPRDYVLRHSGLHLANALLRQALQGLCAKAAQPYRFDGLSWDGRNERFLWGEEAFAGLMRTIQECAGPHVGTVR